MLQKLFAFMLFWSSLSAAPIPARAAEARPAQSGVCGAETEKYCGDVKPGNGRIIDCLKQNAAKLSDACRKDLAGAYAFETVCAGDIEQSCKNVDRRPGKLFMCLTDHSGALTAACKAALAPKKTAANAPARPCAADRAKFCNGVPGSGIEACMISHVSELSAQCKPRWESLKAAKAAPQP